MNGAYKDLTFSIAMRNLRAYRTDLVMQLTDQQRALMAIELTELVVAIHAAMEPRAGDVAISTPRHPEAP